MMGSLVQDLRFGWRTLVRNPGFTAVALLTLALGIGATSAIFSLVDGVLLRPLPYPDPDRLVALWESVPGKGWTREALSYPDFANWRNESRSFEGMAAYRYAGATLEGAGEPERVIGLAATGDLFPLLGAAAALGRTFGPADERPGAPPVVVLSDALWRSRFGGRPEVVGMEVRLGGRSTTVIGIMPPGFRFPAGTSPRDYWIPLRPHGMENEDLKERGAHFLFAIARLKPGLPIATASAELASIAKRLERQFPDTNAGQEARVLPLLEDVVGNARLSLLVLLGAVGMVLLIACTNVASLLLARGAAREREIAVRVALGAERGRIVRMLLTESLLLASLGGILGLILAAWSIDLFLALGPAGLPRLDGVVLDSRAATFTTAVTLLTGVLFGLAPALRAARPALYEALKEGGRSASVGWSGNRLRGVLVVFEIALSLVLLVGAGLLMRSFARLRTVDPGFDPRGVLTAGVSLPLTRYAEPPRQAAYFAEAVARLAALPEVRHAAAIYTLPLGGSNNSRSFTIAGEAAPAEGREPDAHFRAITPDYFRVMGVPLRRGRAFTVGDHAAAPPVAIVNETFARRFLPDQDPIGRRLVLLEPQEAEIVGVVGDVRHAGLHAESGPEYYVPAAQDPQPSMTLVVRAWSDPATLAPALRRAMQPLDSSLALHNVQPMIDLLARSVAQRRFQAILMGSFAALSLLSAAIGLYGVIAFSVARRTREIGIRMALGAHRSDVVRMVVNRAMLLALTGVVLGLLGAGALTRVMSGLLFGISATDPVTFAAVPLLLLAVALLASWLPARRATCVDPMVALRCE